MTKPAPIAQPMEFTEAIAHCFRHYAVFRGTASRSEYWWWFLFSSLLLLAILTVDNAIFGIGIDNPPLFSLLTILALLLPTGAVSARRLHDIGTSGWWQLLIFTIIHIPLVLWWYTRPPILSVKLGPVARPMEFTESIIHCLRHYVVFRGTASRSEFWWWVLFRVLLSVATEIVDFVIFGEGAFGSHPSPITAVVHLVLLLPSLATTVRRLHDIGKSDWWLILYFTIIGIPLLIWFLARPGIPQASEGEDRTSNDGDVKMSETDHANFTDSE